MSSCPAFTQPVLGIFSDVLLLTVLRPRFRLLQQVLKNTLQVLGDLGGKVPGGSLRLISIMLLSGDNCLKEAR
jgi:hypothetical protein